MFNSISGWLKKRVDDVQGAFGVSNQAQTFKTNTQRPQPAQTVSRPQNQVQNGGWNQGSQNQGNQIRQPQMQIEKDVLAQPKFNLNQSLQNNGVSQPSTPKPPPMIARPEQPRPKTTEQLVDESYGTGITSRINRVKDLINPDTAADNIKRRAETGLTQSYDQQQKQRNEAAFNSPQKRGAAGQLAASAGRTLSTITNKAPGAAINIMGIGAEALPGTFSDGYGKGLQKFGTNINRGIDNRLNQSFAGDSKHDNKYINAAGGAAAQIPVQIATGGIGLAGQALQSASDEATKSQEKGKSALYALGVGGIQGGANYASEKVGLDRLTGKVSGGVIRNFASKALGEGAQEVQQQFTQNLLANKLYDKSQGLNQGLKESFVGGLAGGAVGGLGGSAYNKMSNGQLSSSPEVSKPTILDKATDLIKNRPQLNQGGYVEVGRTPKTIHPDDQNVMSDFIDTQRGVYKPTPQAQQALELDASRIAERYGLDMPNTTQKLANVFDQRLQQEKFAMPKPSLFEKAKERLTLKDQGGYIQTPGIADPVVNKKTGETLSQAVERLKNFGWSGKDIQGYKNAVLGKSKPKVSDPNILDSVNPTGGLNVDYDPGSRMKMKLADNITTLDKTMGGNPDDKINVYRGAPATQKSINPGDFITTSKELAASYTGEGNVLEQQVYKSDILDDKNEPLGDEYLYRPQKKSLTERLGLPKLNEGGYVQIPFGRSEVNEGLSKPQIEFINDYAEMLEGMGTGQGVEMVPDAETGYKRISNNVRDAETKGKRMSKYDWFNKAKRDIESGRSMYGASEDYKNLPGVESQAQRSNPDEQFAPDSRMSPEEIASQNASAVRGNFQEQVVEGKPSKPQRSQAYQSRMNQAASPTIQQNTPRPGAVTDNQATVSQSLSQKPQQQESPESRTTQNKQQQSSNQQAGNEPKGTSSDNTIQLKSVDVNDPFGNNSKKTRLRNEFGQYFIDEDAEMINMLKKIEKETGRKDLVENWYQDTDLVRGSNTIANSKLKHNQNIKAALSGLTRKGQTEFDNYASARAELSNVDQGLKSTSKGVAELERTVTDGNEKYAKRFESLNKYYQDWATELHDAGIIDKKKLNEWAKNKDYIRVQRNMEDLLNIQQAGGKSRSFGSTSTTKKRTGSKRDILSPTNIALERGQQLQREIQRNKAATRTIDTLTKYGLAKKIDAKNAVNKNVIKRFNDGKVEFFETNKDIKRVVENVNPFQLGVIARVISTPTRLFRSGTTALSAPFAVTNYARDQLSSAIYSKHVMATHNPKAIVSGIKNAAQDFYGESSHPLWAKFEQVAGDQTQFDELRNAKTSKTINRELRRGRKGEAFNKLTNPVRTMEDLIGITESATRFQNFKGEYNKEFKKSGNEQLATQKATQAALQNSVNFSRAGKAMRVVNLLIPYSNAGVQGSRNVGRSFKERPVATTMKSVGMLAVPTVLMALMNYEDDETKKIYENISETEKADNFVIILPGTKQNEQGSYEGVIKIPKPQGYRELTDPLRIAAEKFAGSEKTADVKDMVKNAMGAFTGSINIEDSNKFVSSFIPQIAKPALQAKENKDYYWGSKTVPEYMVEGTDDPTKRAYKSTSGTARKLADVLNVSPILVEKFVQDTAGSLGRYGTNLSDRLLASTGSIPKEQIGGKSITSDFKRRMFEARGIEKENKTDGQKYFDNVKLATAGLPKHLEDSWKTYNTSNKNFLGEELFEKNSHSKSMAKAAAYIEHPELFGVDKKLDKLSRDKGQPGNPMYDLSYAQALQVVQKKALPPGSKDEGLDKLYDQQWYSQFKNNEDKYYEKVFAGKPNTQKNPYPERSAELSKSMDYYYSLPSSSAKKNFKNANPDIANQMDDYYARKDAWTNTERAGLGLPPIEDKYASFSNGGGSGKSGGGKGRKGRGGRKGGKGKAGGAGTYQVAKTTDISKKLQDIANSASTKGKSSVSTPRKHSAKLKKVRSA